MTNRTNNESLYALGQTLISIQVLYDYMVHKCLHAIGRTLLSKSYLNRSPNLLNGRHHASISCLLQYLSKSRTCVNHGIWYWQHAICLDKLTTHYYASWCLYIHDRSWQPRGKENNQSQKLKYTLKLPSVCIDGQISVAIVLWWKELPSLNGSFLLSNWIEQ